MASAMKFKPATWQERDIVNGSVVVVATHIIPGAFDITADGRDIRIAAKDGGSPGESLTVVVMSREHGTRHDYFTDMELSGAATDSLARLRNVLQAYTAAL